METGSATPFLAGSHPHPPQQGPEQVSSLSPAQLLPGGKERKLVAQCASGLFWFSCNLSSSHQPCVVNSSHLAQAVGHTPRATQETLRAPHVTCEPWAQTTSIRSHGEGRKDFLRLQILPLFFFLPPFHTHFWITCIILRSQEQQLVVFKGKRVMVSQCSG